MSIKTLFKLAQKKREEGAYIEALKTIKEVIEKYPNSTQLYKILTLQGGIYFHIGDFEKAITSYTEVLKLEPSFELASLGIYLSYKELQEDSKAIHELEHFLNKYEADLYKTTIEELLEGLEQGYAKNFEIIIKGLAKKNNVSLIPGSSC